MANDYLGQAGLAALIAKIKGAISSAVSGLLSKSQADGYYQPKGNYATSAQGSKADSAIQPNDNVSYLNNDAGYLTSHDIFVATYNVTSYNDILTAYNAGKLCVCVKDNEQYIMNKILKSGDWITFEGVRTSDDDITKSIVTLYVATDGTETSWFADDIGIAKSSELSNLAKTDGSNITTDFKKIVNSSNRGSINVPVFVNSEGAHIECKFRNFYRPSGKYGAKLFTVYTKPANSGATIIVGRIMMMQHGGWNGNKKLATADFYLSVYNSSGTITPYLAITNNVLFSSTGNYRIGYKKSTDSSGFVTVEVYAYRNDATCYSFVCYECWTYLATANDSFNSSTSSLDSVSGITQASYPTS